MNMSFMLTVPQMQAGTKGVTRRLGKRRYTKGQILNAIIKGQGLKKGEKVQVIRKIRIESDGREPIRAIIDRPVREPHPTLGAKSEVELEGFPDMTPAEFATMLCENNGVILDDVIDCNRIVFTPL